MFFRMLPLFTFMLFACSTNEKSLSIDFIPSPAGNNAAVPNLFTDPSGEAFLSWIENRDTIQRLLYSRWIGHKWSEPVAIASGSNWFVNWADYPMMASDGKGNMMAAFLEKSSDAKFTYNIKITTSTNGTTWSVPVVLHDDDKLAEHGFVSLIPFGEHFFVSWLDGRNTVNHNMNNTGHNHHGAMTIRAAVLGGNGTRHTEWEIDNRVCDCCQTASAITANGPVVVYRDRSHNEVRDMSIVRMVNGNWTQPQPVHADNWNISGCPVNGPRCQAIGNSLAVAWFTMAHDVPVVKVAFSQNGGENFDKPIQVNTGETIGRVDLVLLDEYTAIVSWMEGSEIKAARVNHKGKVDRITLIAKSSENRASGFPQLTNAGDGLLMAWTDSELKTIRTAKLGME